MIANRVRVLRLLGAPLLAVALAAGSSMPSLAAQDFYTQANLVSDVPGLAASTDPDLVNPWGLTRSATSPWWVSDNGTGKSTLYNGAGNKLALVVTVPPPSGSTPTGVVFNGGSGFVVMQGMASGPARFIFATEDGTISGWNPAVDPTHAIIAVNNAGSAIYKGLTLAKAARNTYLYPANFKSVTADISASTLTATSVAGQSRDSVWT